MTADYDKHTDAELRDGIRKAAREDRRIATEDSPQALDAERTQRHKMAAELERRRRTSGLAWVRAVAGGGLAFTAAGLAIGAKVTGKLADALRAEDRDERRQPAASSPPRTPRPAAAPTAAETSPAPDRAAAAAPEPVETPATDEPQAHQRRPATHIAELAARPANEVVAAVVDLSTDELRLLFDEERAGKRRKTVLAAIERAAAPPDTETVYTSGG